MSSIEDTKRETFSFVTENCTPKEEIVEEDEYKDVLMYEEDPSLQCYQQNIKEETEFKLMSTELTEEELQCSFCNNPVTGCYYACVQCFNYQLCKVCESREVHESHYMLRVPKNRPCSEVQSVLELVTTQLYLREIPVKPSTDNIFLKPNGNDILFRPNNEEIQLKPNSDDILLNTNGQDLIMKPSNDDFLPKSNSHDYLIKLNENNFINAEDSLLKSDYYVNYCTDSSDERSSTDLEQNKKDHREPPTKNTKVHIKKPLNAFMLYMKEMRPSVLPECKDMNASAVNQILGKQWNMLSKKEQAKYYDMALKERQKHRQLYPNWRGKKKQTQRHTYIKKKPFLKCRAKYGVDHRHLWCTPCLRKKKCQQYTQALAAAKKILLQIEESKSPMSEAKVQI